MAELSDPDDTGRRGDRTVGGEPRALDVDDVRVLRVRAQGLVSRETKPASVAQVVAASAGMQAQQWSAALLSVRVRSTGLRAGDVEEAREVERSVVRGWFMRGTLHLVPTADFRWLLDLYAPVTLSRLARRHAQLGLDQGLREHGATVIRAAVTGHGPLTRAELVEELLRRGIRIDPRSQAVPHLIAYACLRGVICHGPHRDGEPAFALLSDWLPALPTLDPDAAVNELARRYLGAFGPATLEDFASWSGLPRSRARVAWQRIGGELTEVRVLGMSAWMLRSHAVRLDELESRAVGVRLLPAFDTYLLGYESRALVVDEPYARRVWPGGGMLRPTVISAGRAVGTWRYEARGKNSVVRVAPFTDAGPELHPQLREEAEDVGRFLGSTTTLSLEEA